MTNVIITTPREGFKFCTKCKVEKEFNAFALDSRKRRGPQLQSWCRECIAIAKAAWQATPEGAHSRSSYDKEYKSRPVVKENKLFIKHLKYNYLPEVREKELNKVKSFNKTPKGRAVQYRAHLKQMGMTERGYNDLLERQGGGCAICLSNQGGDHRRLAIDHDHGKLCHPTKDGACEKCIRGLLCDMCNRGLGMLKENPDTLFIAAVYLTPKLIGKEGSLFVLKSEVANG